MNCFAEEGCQPEGDLGCFFLTLTEASSYLHISRKDPPEWGTLMIENREDSPEICLFFFFFAGVDRVSCMKFDFRNVVRSQQFCPVEM